MLNNNYLTIIKNIVSKYLNLQKDFVFIFGSRATETEQTFSDIDIGIERKTPIKGSTIVKMQGDFENSDLPFNVDIVDFSRVSERFKTIARQHIIPLNTI